MARDETLEALLREHLADAPGVSDIGMFGGRCWLLDGHLLCCARHDGMLVRLGKGNDQWALAMPGVAPMMSGKRRMAGWVRVERQAACDKALRRCFMDAASAFVRSLPPKPTAAKN